MKTITTEKYAQYQDPQGMEGLRTPYRLLDDKGQERGKLILSELEAQVLMATFQKGDLMIAKFKIVK